ncbi:MAG TPA: Ig-like domain-containing protein, partial [Gemmatimonadaceae bacterium]|nr:Ig-like domain-containing protein [Gemmatimonadaceae bacterium]
MAAAALTLALGACAETAPVAPPLVQRPLLSSAAALPSVRIAEIHYDNTGTDAGEAIEVSAPAGTDLTGWSLVLYNGNGGVTYTPTVTFSTTVADLCSGRGVVVANYAVNGIQNGSPDGVALVNASGAVVEFLSYEGTFLATNGPALGMTSVDIGVIETGSEPLGQSLQRKSDGTWASPATHTFGSCNDNGPVTPPATVAAVNVTPNGASLQVGGTQQFTATATDANGAAVPTATFAWSSTNVAVAAVSATGLVTAVAPGSAQIVATEAGGKADTVDVTVAAAPPPLPATRFSEIHYDNFGTDVGEAIEVEGPAGTSLSGWSIVLYNGNGGAVYNTTPLTGTIPNLCSGRGVIAVSIGGIQNGNPDGFALVDANGALVEFLSYGGTFAGVGGAANGVTSTDIGVTESSATQAGQSLQRDNNGVWQPAATAGFGACYGQTPPPPSNTIAFTGRTASDPALPVGFEDQLFATMRDPQGNVLTTTFTWTSETPAIASVDANGVVRALTVGTFTVRATAADGTTAT